MERVNLHDAYLMGRAFRTLEDLTAQTIPSSIAADLTVLKGWLNHLLTLSIIPKGKLHQNAEILHQAVLKMLDEWRNVPLGETRADLVKVIFGELRPMMSSEFAKLHTYFIPPVGIFSTDALLAEPEKMFGDNAQYLPAETLIEIKEVGKCLAFSLPTACGFHLMRATESILRHYYDVLSSGAPRPARGPMGAYLDAIIKLPAVDLELHAALKQIKTLYRDPIAHPEIVLTPEEALSLLGVVQSAISRVLILTKPTTP